MIKIDDKEIRNPIEQIKKNMDDIEKLKDQIYEVYNYNGVIGSTEIPYVNRSSTNVPEDVNKGWLVDYTGKLFKITGGNTTTLLLDYYASIKGPAGNTGPQGEQGIQGNPGVGIVSIEKTSTSGLVDTYTITYTNGQQSTFTVTNGEKGDPGVPGPTYNAGDNIQINNSTKIISANENIIPKTSYAYDLGSDTKLYKNVYTGGIKNKYFNVVTAGVNNHGTALINTTDNNGNTENTVRLDQSGVQVDNTIRPKTNSAIDLGTSFLRFDKIYVNALNDGTNNVNVADIKTYTAGDGIDITSDVISVDTDTVALKSEIPDVSDFVTTTELSTTLDDYELKADIITLESSSGTLSAADLAKIVDHPNNCYIKTLGWYLQLHEVTSTYITYASVVPAGSEVVKAQITIATGDYAVTSQKITLKAEVNSIEYSPDNTGKITLPDYPDAVVANPVLAGTESDLTSIQVGSTKYKVSGGGSGNSSSGIYLSSADLDTTINYNKIILISTITLGTNTLAVDDIIIGANKYVGVVTTIGVNPNNQPVAAVKTLGNITDPDLSSYVTTTSLSTTLQDYELKSEAFSGSYNDLTDKPTIPTKTSDLTNDSGYITGVSWSQVTDKPTFATVATTGDYDDLTDKPDLSIYAESADLATVATTGDYDDLLDKPDLSVYELAADAFSGDYTDLTNKPTIPTQTSQLTNNSGFITKDVDDLTYYTKSSNLANVATSGSYNDLTNKPTIPDDFTLLELTDESTSGTLTAEQLAAITANPQKFILKRGTVYYWLVGIGTSNMRYSATSGFTSNITSYVILITKSTGAWAYTSKIQPIFSGSYNDLTDKPTIPSDIVVIEVSNSIESGTLTASEYTQLSTYPTKTIIKRGNYYYKVNLETDSYINLECCNGGYNTIRAYEITVQKSNYAWSYSTSLANYTIIDENLIPKQNNYYSLGSSNYKYEDLYLAGNLTDGTNSVAIANIAKTTDIPDTSNMVTIDTTQTITGDKEFTNNIKAPYLNIPAIPGYYPQLEFTDNTNHFDAHIYVSSTIGNRKYYILPSLYNATADKTIATTDQIITSYNDLTDKPTIPTVPITEIQVNNTTVSPVSGVVDITVPTNVSSLTNDSGYTTSSDIATAINNALYYKNGDTFNNQTYYATNGLLTGGGKQIAFNVRVDKSLKNITSVTVDKLNIIFRGVAGYVNGSAYIDYADTTGYTVTATITSEYEIYIVITATTAFANGTNNSPINIVCSNTVGAISLTFNVA